jgi:hypothetical protein
MGRRRLATILALGLVLEAGAAVAQGTDVSRFTIGAAGGVAFPLHGDLQFQAGAWQVNGRGRLSEHVWLEALFAEWRHTAREVFAGQPVHGPAGPLGRIGRITAETRHVVRTLDVHALLGGTSNRVTAWAGGGAGYIYLDRRFRQTPGDCQGGVTCPEVVTRHAAGSLAVQATGGVDIAVMPRIVVFGQYLFAVPVDDPGSGHQSVMAGARVVLW